MPERLAEIVIETGLADRAAVLRAAGRAEEHKEPLVVALVKNEKVDELALVAAIKRHVRIAIIDPAQVDHDPEALRQVSRDVCRRLRIMPLACHVHDNGSKTLRLAMADPTDTVTLAEIEHITGCQVESALMPLSAIEELVETGYRSYVTEVIPRKHRNGRGRKGKRSGKGSEERAGSRTGDRTDDRPDDRPDDRADDRATHRPDGPKSVHATAVRDLQDDADRKPQLITGSADSTSPTTVPFHRVADEASLEIRHRALLDILLAKGVVTEEEYKEQVRLLMKRRSDEP